MGKFSLKYGHDYIDFSLDSGDMISTIKSKNFEDSTEEEVILSALKNPVDSARLRYMVKKNEKICIIVSDVTRAWQRMDIYLPYIIEELKYAGVPDENIIFLCATGSHRKQSEQEKKKIMGDLYSRFTFIEHDCTDEKSLVYLGDTSFNTPVKVNKVAMECDHIILTGAIVFHDLAGWSGGRKSLIPGIAGYDTIMSNHGLALKEKVGEGIRETVTCGNFKDNIVHLDMEEGANMIKPSFLFNVIIGDNGSIVEAVAGNYVKAHRIGCKKVTDRFAVDIEKKADLVLASCGGYPKDMNLYQGSKGLINSAKAVKKNGWVILLAQCEEGIGHPEVEEVIRDFDSNIERELYVRNNYSISRYSGYLITKTIENFNTILVSGIDEKILENSNITVVKTIEEALEIFYKNYNKNTFDYYIIPDGGSTMPVVNNI